MIQLLNLVRIHQFPPAGKPSMYSARMLQLVLYGKIYLETGFIFFFFFKWAAFPKLESTQLPICSEWGDPYLDLSGLWGRKKVGEGLKHPYTAGKGEWATQS